MNFRRSTGITRANRSPNLVRQAQKDYRTTLRATRTTARLLRLISYNGLVSTALFGVFTFACGLLFGTQEGSTSLRHLRPHSLPTNGQLEVAMLHSGVGVVTLWIAFRHLVPVYQRRRRHHESEAVEVLLLGALTLVILCGSVAWMGMGIYHQERTQAIASFGVLALGVYLVYANNMRKLKKTIAGQNAQAATPPPRAAHAGMPPHYNPGMPVDV